MEKLTIENWKQLQPYTALADYHEYNSNPMTMLMWSNKYEVYFKTTPKYAIVYVTIPGRSPIWLMPFCKKEDRKEAVKAIQEYSSKIQIDFEIHSMTKEFKDWLMEAFPMDFLVWDCYDARDYVYDRFQQQSLSGKKMQKRRNHYYAFLKQYQDRFEYRNLKDCPTEEIYDFLSFWQSQKEEEESIKVEEKGIHLFLENQNTLPIEGGCIYIDGKLEAFIIASRLANDMIQIHVEKANRNIRGLYIAILKLFLETLEEDIKYINREDDMGSPALRKAKKDMQPITKIQKFACSYEPLQIRTADDSMINQIKELWLNRFEEETKESTDFYFSNLYQKENCYVLTYKEKLICMLQLRWFSIIMNDKPVETPFVVGVATDSEYEGCGYMKILLNHVLAKLETPYVLIQAYNWDIYRSFGFQEQYYRMRYKIRKEEYPQTSKGYFKESTHAEELLSIYNAYCINKNGYRLRDIAYYEKQLLPYISIWNQKLIVYYEQDIAKGYMILNESDEEILVSECIYTSEEVLSSMMQYFYQETRTVYVDVDEETIIKGRGKKQICMMVKQLSNIPFPNNQLFIREEL